MNYILNLENEFSQATISLLKKLEEKINNHYLKQGKLNEDNINNKTFPIYIAGGIGVNFYTGERPSYDIDMECAPELFQYLDQDLIEKINEKELFFDYNYNPTLGLMHEDYLDNALEIPFEEIEKHNIKIKPYVISPLDLAVSKLARYSESDRNDILDMFEKGLFNLEDFEKKAKEAIDYYIGNPNFVQINLNEMINFMKDEKIEKLLNVSSGLNNFSLKEEIEKENNKKYKLKKKNKNEKS